MSENKKPLVAAKLHPLLPAGIRPLQDGLIVSILLIAIACVSSFSLYQKSKESLEIGIKNQLLRIAEGAASLVDGNLYETFTHRDQEATDAYKNAVAPLKKLLHSIQGVRYIYTMRLAGDKVLFVLDSAPYGDTDNDGVEDHSYLMDPYDDVDEEALRTLREGAPTTSKEPYTDRWGTFISGYAPIFNSEGKQVGALGVDMTVENFKNHVAKIQRTMLAGLVLPIMLSVFVGFGVYLMRRRSLELETDRVKNLEELRQSTERYQILSQATNDAVWDWDFVTDRVEWNGAVKTLFGYEDAEEIHSGNWWKSKIHPDDRERITKTIHEQIDKRMTIWLDEYRFLRADGSYADVLDRGYLLLDPQGRAVRMIGAMMDVSNQKRLQGQLIQSQKMETVGSLAGGVAHDLNNKLTPLVGYLDLVAQDKDLKPSSKSLLDAAVLAANSCTSVVDRLLNFSRPSSQQKIPLDTKKLLSELAGLLKTMIPANIEVSVNYPEDLALVIGNKAELHSVLVNLAANAKEAMPQGGKLSIHAYNLDQEKAMELYKKNRSCVVFSLKDTGCGIAPNVMARIFEPFFTTRRGKGGTGLGLPMAFNIVKDHGGQIDVESEPNQGTTFTFFIPTAPVDGKTYVEKNTEPALPHGDATILFADDEAPLRQLGKVFLDRLGYEVLLAADAEEAVETYRANKHKIKVVILDMTMPKMTGLAALKKILEIQPKAKVLLASGHTSEGSAEELLKEGAVGFLKKPYTIYPLAQAIFSALRSSS